MAKEKYNSSSSLLEPLTQFPFEMMLSTTPYNNSDPLGLQIYAEGFDSCNIISK